MYVRYAYKQMQDLKKHKKSAPELVKVAHGVAEQEHGEHGEEVGVEGGAPHGVEAHSRGDLLAVGHLEADGDEVQDGPRVGGQPVHLELRVRLHVAVRAWGCGGWLGGGWVVSASGLVWGRTFEARTHACTYPRRW